MPYWGNLALESLSDYTTTTVYRNGTTYTSVDDNTLGDIGSFTISASSPNSEARFTNMGTYDFLRSSNVEAKIDNDKWAGDISYSFTVSVSPNSGFQYSKPYVVSTSANANYNSSSFTIMGNSIYLETFNQSLDCSGTLGHNIFETGTNYYINIIILMFPKSYKITYDANGGNITSGSSSEDVLYYDNYNPPTATRTGYTFNRWENSDGGLISSAVIANAKNKNVTAYWTANSYKVTLDRQGASNGSSSVTATYDSTMPSISVPTKTGYTFQGYYTGTSGGGIVGYAKGSTVLTGCGFSGAISAQANSGALIGSSVSGVRITDCIVFSANVDKLNSGSANTTNTIYVLNGKKGYTSGEFANWVFVSGMPYPVPKGLSWLAQGGNQASLTDIQNWVNS